MADVLVVRRLRERQRKLRIPRKSLRDKTNPFDLKVSEFVQEFRLSKEAARFLVDELLKTELLDMAPNGLSVEMQVLLTLQFLGCGSFQWVVAKTAGCHQSSISRYVDRVLNAILKIAKRFIHFPTSEAEVSATRHRFFNKLGFPNTLGAVDCTHIEIQKPDREDWFNFINRRGKFTINVQAICDADLKILDINPRWPGSWHDALIWNLSGARKLFADEIINSDVFLLGDSGYPLEPWLMTPFADPTGPAEEIYNRKQSSARNVIERCFGVMKARFRVLSRTAGILCYNPKKVAIMIIAVAVLHNICIMHNLDTPIDANEVDDDDDNNEEDDRQSISQGPLKAILKRQEIANAFQAAR